MFEEIFNKPNIVARHKNAAQREQRESFLRHLANEGYCRGSLAAYSRRLLSVVDALGAETGVSREQLEVVAKRCAPADKQCPSFMRVATSWYGFLGKLPPKATVPSAFSKVTDDLRAWLTHERGLAPRTINGYCWHAQQFFQWYAAIERPLEELSIEDVDRHLIDCGQRGLTRRGIANRATALRILLRRAAICGWCSPLIASAIERPRIYDLEGLPVGPTWEDVARMLAAADTNAARDVRDRAILMLFSIYGLRASEVAGLRLDDIDWDNERILVRRGKRRSAHWYPLVSVVGNAIIRYIREFRQRSSRREIFLTLTAPVRATSRGALYSLVRNRLDELEITSRRRGPHALRHACAIHLVEQGLSLKEIGDHLGHQSSSSTRVYAKVDLRALREVADFDLGGVL